MDNFFKRNLTSADYRRKAQENCDKQKNALIIIFLIYLVISIVVGIVDSLTGKTIILEDGTVEKTTWFQSIFTLLTGGAFAFSFAEISKKVYLKIDVKNEDLAYGFKDFARSFKLYILQSLYIALWTLLFIIPGIVKSISYSMAVFIANDHKELTATECIDKSKEMMNGHKMEYFSLVLSYLGWLILCVLTLGILTLWVTPRMNQATYLFYLKVSGIGQKYEDSLNEATQENDDMDPFGNR